MSATWKMIGKGGTAKVKEFFCHCCDCVSSKITHNNQTVCDVFSDFIEERPIWQDNWKCYHCQIITSKYMDKLRQEYENLKCKFTTSLDEVEKNIELKIITHDETEKISDPYLIDFQPTTVCKASQFQDLLAEEILLHDLDIIEKSREDI